MIHEFVTSSTRSFKHRLALRQHRLVSVGENELAVTFNLIASLFRKLLETVPMSFQLFMQAVVIEDEQLMCLAGTDVLAGDHAKSQVFHQ